MMRRPGIHNPGSGLWIPGSRPEARPGMTVLKTRHRVGVLDLGRRGEMRADQRAPFVEFFRAAKIDRVILQRLPLDVQPVARRLFDGAVQLEADPALAALEDRLGLRDGSLKLLFAAGLDVDLSDFGDHGAGCLRKLLSPCPDSIRASIFLWKMMACRVKPEDADLVMPGLVPGIHVLAASRRKTWMAGTSPAMTLRNQPNSTTMPAIARL